MLLEGKVAIVSGIGPGMGRDISLAFAREGADVVLGGRTLSQARGAWPAEVEALGRAGAARACATSPTRTRARSLADRAAAELGRLDILVNNAFHGGDAKTLMDADLDDWRQTMDVNLFGTLAHDPGGGAAPGGAGRRPDRS